MRTAILALALILFPVAVSAQHKPLVKRAADPCAPIGKTADGKLVYSLKCDAIPVPVVTAPPPPAVQAAPPPPPPEEEDKGGLFRNPFPSIIRPTNIQRMPGVGPAGAGP